MLSKEDAEELRAHLHETVDRAITHALAGGELRTNTSADTEDIGCDRAGCPGCSAAHRWFTGKRHLEVHWQEVQ